MTTIHRDATRLAVPRFCSAIAVLALWLGSVCTGVVMAQAEVTPVPAQFTSGARIKVVSEGLATATTYRLQLEEPRPGTRTWRLGSDFSSGVATRATTSVVIPEVAAGPYQLVLYRVQITTTQVAMAAVTVRPRLTVALTPTSTPQGKSVRVSVGGLAAGTVRVRFADATVIGPVPTSGGTWVGKFVVPRDRPASVPATVPLLVENIVGRAVVATGSADLQILAATGLPTLGATITQIPTGQVPRGGAMQVRGRLQTDDGIAPAGRQRAYWRSPGGRMVPVDDQITMATDGTFTLFARAPDTFLDGVEMFGDGRGELMVVNQGTDTHTDRQIDSVASVTTPSFVAVDIRQAIAGELFTVVVRGDGPGSDDPLLSNVYVEVQANFRAAFSFANNNAPGLAGAANAPVMLYTEEQVFGAIRPNQMSGGLFRGTVPGRTRAFDGYGCDITYYRKQTNEQGRAAFVVDPEKLVNTNLINDCQHAQCRGDDYFMSFVLDIIAGHRGYRRTAIEVGFDEDTGEFINRSTGLPFPNRRVEVLLERMQTEDFDLRNLRIDGLEYQKTGAPCPPGVTGPCAYSPTWFGTMYTYPDENLWPSTGPRNVFTQINSGRMMRLSADPALFGGLTFGRVRIGNTPWASFNASATPSSCLLGTEEEPVPAVEYVAALPDLTRLPVAAVTTNNNGTASGGIDGVIELRFGTTPLRSIPFKIATQRPPDGIHANNPAIATLQINGLTDTITGDYAVPSPRIDVASPGYGVGRLDSRSTNDSAFAFVRTPDSVAALNIDAVSDNQIAGVPGGPRAAEGTFFGFTDSTHTTPDPVVLFDTGLIPLFRYSWGLPPIAAATLGADFWMAADLAFYGELKTAGMNATIDPTVAGGVNLTFDLDVLMGLASASIAAESEIGVTLRSVIGSGGQPGQQSGRCFRFDLDAVWEACAVGICDGGRAELIRERQGSGCSGLAADGFMLAQGGNVSGLPHFDLPRPRATATALATDGRGNSIALAIEDSGNLVATHLNGNEAVATRTIAPRPVAVQHVAVVFHATNRAMAVWSENRLSEAAVRSLMVSQGGRAFDDIVRTQRLRFSVFDGRVWSAPADLTAVGNDGKPQLAGCTPPARFMPSGCPTGGEITAVWERDANANLDAPDIEVWSATWTPAGGWRSVARVSAATGASSDMLPSVAYRNGTPIVAWATNPAGHFSQLGGRRVAYRFLDGSPAVRADALGLGVGWVSIGVSSEDAVVIAYTRAQDTEGFVGNRQALFAARATTCAAGTCNFLVTEPRDEAGRQYRVERPRVVFDDDDTPIIGFRAVAFGAGTNGQVGLPGDPPGTLLGTGELGVVRVHSFAQARYTARFVALSGDGLQHWKPDVVYDPSVGGLLALSTPAIAPARAGESMPMRAALAYAQEPQRARTAAMALGGGSEVRILGGGPDFLVRNVLPSRTVVAPGQSTSIRLELANVGAAYDPAVHGSVRVTTSWNAPGGAGIAGPSFTLSDALASNAGRAVTLLAQAPASVRDDERQTLFIEIDADESANAIGGEADRELVEFNALPVPQGVNAQGSPGSPLVSLGWAPTTDARVVGWRVWKLAADGSWRHLGSSPVAGYMDHRATPGAAAQYRVAAYSRNGIESEPSAPAYIFVEAVLTDALFGNGFETPAP